jgi:membrane-associated protease RseP (regulator of RpoE activity)
VGTSLIFEFFKHYVADPALLPNRFEIIHYPFLFVGYITLFFTALNLLPIGQLDGGHITYGLFGRFRAGIISRVVVTALIIYGGLGLVVPFTPGWLLNLSLFLLYLFYLSGSLLGRNAPPLVRLLFTFCIIGLQQVIQWWHPVLDFNFLWLFYAFMAVRVIRLDHPPARVELPLNRTRKILGWMALGIFVLCFSPDPLQMVSYGNIRNNKDEKSVFTYEHELKGKFLRVTSNSSTNCHGNKELSGIHVGQAD